VGLVHALALGSATSAGQAKAASGGGALSETEQLWIEDNPALADVAANAPDQLREILDVLAAVLENPSSTRGDLPALDEDTVRLLGDNPTLFQAWRSSPEASADLLQLIRIAAGSGKPRK
jgi:hypothetical protein